MVRQLQGEPVEVTVSVATSYGHSLLSEEEGHILEGRLDRVGMVELLKKEAFGAVFDATHPFAVEVTQTLREVCGQMGVPYYRVVRASNEVSDVFPDMDAAAQHLITTSGPVLLTVGSKRLDAFVRDPGFPGRYYPRVLPTVEAIERCLALGFRQSQILAMQGPFSADLNAAIIRQYGIRLVVSKESGSAGGFEEKRVACEKTGAALVVIGRPVEETGFTVSEAVKAIQTGVL